MKIYTRFGDRGQTQLMGGIVVDKSAHIIDWIGTLDELNSTLGFALSHAPVADQDQSIHRVQEELFEWGALLARAPAERHNPPTAAAVEQLESEIDRWQEELPPMTHFILPGGSPAAASLHFARTICRRAERCGAGYLRAEREAAGLGERDDLKPLEELPRYLNRLSDWLFVLARLENHRAGRAEQKWEPQNTE